jgi:ribose transport system substrate-binding protein
VVRGLNPIRRLAAVVVSTAVALACGVSNGSSGSQSKPMFFDYANASDSAAIFKALGDAVEKDAAVAGIKLKRYNNNLDGPTAVNNARLMVNDHPDLILDWSQAEGVGPALGKTFHDAKIPCIAVNIPIPNCAWFNLSNKQFGIDGANIIAPMAKAKGWTAADTVVLIGQAAQAGTEVNDSPRYFYVTAAKQMEGMDQVAPESIGTLTTTIGKSGIQYDCANALQPSYTAVKNLLPTIPASKHILLWTPNDDCTMGALRAITEAGRAANTLTGGVVATPDAVQQLRTNPVWVCEGELFIDGWAEYLLAMGVQMRKGVKPSPLTIAPQVMMTKQTVDQYLDASGNWKQLPPLPPEDQYLKDAGVLQKFHNVPGV